MQLPDLLNAAKNLDLQEQIELATQLLLWIEAQLNQNKPTTEADPNQSTVAATANDSEGGLR